MKQINFAMFLLLTIAVYFPPAEKPLSCQPVIIPPPSDADATISTAMVEHVGLFDTIENNTYYINARLPAINSLDLREYRITHYGRPLFPPSNYTARWPMKVEEALNWSNELALDGICAVWTTTPWYNRIRDEHPPILYIEDHGLFLAVDRVGHGTDIDIYLEDSTPPQFAHYKNVIEVRWPDE